MHKTLWISKRKVCQGIHHLGFWADDLEETEKKIEKSVASTSRVVRPKYLPTHFTK